MGNDSADDSLRRVAECIAIAGYLIERGRFAQALEPLNEAIKIAPDDPLVFAKRALVCEELGLSAQAAADRQRVLQLASKSDSAKASMQRARVALTGSPEPDDTEPPPPPPSSPGASDSTARAAEAPVQPEPSAPAGSAEPAGAKPEPPPSPSFGASDPEASAAEVPRQPEPPPPGESVGAEPSPPPSPSSGPSDPAASAVEVPAQPESVSPPRSTAGASEPEPRSSSSSGGIISGVFTVLMIVGAIAAVGGGVLFAIDELSDGGGSPALVASPLGDTSTPVPTPTITPAPTLTATPIPTEASTPLPDLAPVTGVPFSLSSVENGWEAAGFTVIVRGDSDRLSGFSIGATDVSLDGPAGAGEFTILVYADDKASATDWDLAIGQLPDPKPGRSLPDHATIWWNSNIIAVVRTITGDITPALDALFQIAP